MGRYVGASCKICRRSREKLYLKGERCHTAKCAIEKRNFPPGPRASAPRKMSEYGKRLREKQKLRFYYGISEQQIRNYFEEAARQKGITGHVLLSLLERRLDNIVFRAGLARSRKEARQLVRHGHFKVNSQKGNIPSQLVNEGDVVHILELDKEYWKKTVEALAQSPNAMPSWLSFNNEQKSIKFVSLPKREELDVPVQEQLIVEFYSR